MKSESGYIGMVSSDWNQCLAPCGPFDAVIFRYPHLQTELDSIFRSYTANAMTLSCAIEKILVLLPAPLTEADMDAYIAARFKTYAGVIDLINWCAGNHILFMINTTGPMGYFQRLQVKGHLPSVPAVSAHPFIQFKSSGGRQGLNYRLIEIADKGLNSSKVAKQFNIQYRKVIVIGDSGGDGPHFSWAAASGATTISSMAKPSLIKYCEKQNIPIQHSFGHTYAEGEPVAAPKEKHYDFMQLSTIISQILSL